MSVTKNFIGLSILGMLPLFAAACGEEGPEQGSPNTPQPRSYTTTSNVGDLSNWTIVDNDLTVEWQDIAPGTGAVEKIYDAKALCTDPNADFGYRNCLVDGDALCTDGTEVCVPGDGPQDGETFRIFEVPGVALIVSANEAELHTGFAAGGCETVATDDYTFVNVGLGQDDVIGLFRTDTDFSKIYHMDFGFSDGPDGQIQYNTADVAGLATGLTVGPCENGVRNLTSEDAGMTMRLMLTAAGHFLLDKPEGEGGMVAINSQNAATIADFANKSWGGISFPDNGEPEFISLTTGDQVDGRVEISSLVLSSSGDITPAPAAYINDGTTGTKLNETMLEPGLAYDTNFIVGSGDYTTGPSALPGVFEIDSINDSTAILGIGATVGGQTILFGAVVNEYEGSSNGVKGNFILVER